MTTRTTLAAALLALAAIPAQAQLFRSYVSSQGSDANPCTLQLPCRLLPAALAAVADGGEIWMMDSANYNTGTVTVGKSVSILSVPGAQGSLVVNGATALAVSATNLRVALRNVFFVPVTGATQPATAYGVSLAGSSSTVTLDQCVLAGLPNDAIFMSAGRLVLIDSVVRDSLDGYAILLSGTSGTISVAGSKLLNNLAGGVRISTFSGASHSVTDSVIANLGRVGMGISMTSINGGMRMHLAGVKIDGMEDAISVGPGSIPNAATISRSTITNNTTAFSGNVQSTGDNHVAGNVTPGSVTALAPM